MKIYTNKDFTKEIVSKYDQDTNPTKFRIGLMTTTERESINSLLTDITEPTAQKVIRAAVELGLKGWEDLYDGDGNKIEFKTIRKKVNGLPEREVIHPDLYDLPQMFDLWHELATEIRQFSSLKERDLKN